MKQTYPLPKKPIEYNNLIRLINLDIGNKGLYFIQTNRKDDLDLGVINLWAYRQDVRDDRTNIFKTSESLKIKKKHEVTIVVRKDLYKLFGMGTLSPDLSFAFILPKTPEELPRGIRDDKDWNEAFSNLIQKKNTEATITEHYEERNAKQSEAMTRVKSDEELDKSLGIIEKVAKKALGYEKKEKVEQKSKE